MQRTAPGRPFHYIAAHRVARIVAALVAAFACSGTAQAALEATRYEKLRALYSHWGMPEEPDRLEVLRDLDGIQTREGWERLLPRLDPSRQLLRYATWDARGVRLFRDRDAKKQEDAYVRFAATTPGQTRELRELLEAGRSPDPARPPLRGLRVALDPGHEGGDSWYRLSGKYVSSGGTTLREGVLTLQTSLLLAARLRALGAEVSLTRDDLEPVTRAGWATMPLEPYALMDLRARSDAPWFDSLLSAFARPSKTLFAAFDRSSQVREARAEKSRGRYFFQREDLIARRGAINDFRPHLTVAIHFDASSNTSLQRSVDRVLGYVPGNFLDGEIAAREDRHLFLRHAIDGRRWSESVALTGAIARALGRKLRIPLASSETGYLARKVVDGVYARNLGLNRNLVTGAQAYLECLVYDHEAEFRRLALPDRTAEIGGHRFVYSSRLDEVVDGIRDGLLDYMAGLGRPGAAETQRGDAATGIDVPGS